MYKYVSQPTLFDTDQGSGIPVNNATGPDQEFLPVGAESPVENFPGRQDYHETGKPETELHENQGKKLERIVMFYTDKTFSEYNPS